MATTQTSILSEVSSACQQASDLFSRADMIVRKIKALGMVTLDGGGNITGTNVPTEAFEGTLEGLDARDVLGFLMTFGAISNVIGTPIDQTDARVFGDALLRFAAASR